MKPCFYSSINITLNSKFLLMSDASSHLGNVFRGFICTCLTGMESDSSSTPPLPQIYPSPPPQTFVNINFLTLYPHPSSYGFAYSHALMCFSMSCCVTLSCICCSTSLAWGERLFFKNTFFSVGVDFIQVIVQEAWGQPGHSRSQIQCHVLRLIQKSRPYHNFIFVFFVHVYQSNLLSTSDWQFNLENVSKIILKLSHYKWDIVCFLLWFVIISLFVQLYIISSTQAAEFGSMHFFNVC